ncbi:transposable element Tcb1 transposase [Trichonephila clavipes]|nr:transposable element Tcb1 transposase [Trichonephila clavipes]
MTEAGGTARRVASQPGHSNCVGTSGYDRCSVLENQDQDALDRPAVEKTSTSDESSFNLSSDDNSLRVWRPHGERLNPAFALQRHTAPTAGVRVWGVIAYNTRSRPVLIRGTMTAQRYFHGILQPHVLPLMQQFAGTIFKQDNSWHQTARVSQDCYYPSLACLIPRFVSDRAYLGSLWMASWRF